MTNSFTSVSTQCRYWDRHRWFQVTVWLGPRAVEPAFISNWKIRWKRSRQSYIFAYQCFSGHYLQLYLQSDRGLRIARVQQEKKASLNRQRHRLLFTNGPPHAKSHQTNQEWRRAKRNRTLNEVVKILNPLLHNSGHPTPPRPFHR